MIKIKRAQLAVETLLIYGIALLIVMIAIGALIGFGVLDVGGLLPDKCEISNALSCENYAVGTSEVQLELRNVLGKNIEGFSVLIEGEGNDEGIWDCTEGYYGKFDVGDDGTIDDDPADNPNEFEDNDDDFGHNVLVNGEISDVVSVPCALQVPPGKKINGVITIVISPVGSSIKRTVSGSIRATVS